MEIKGYKIIITGRVQGVWFRKYTKEKAESLKLKGFVQNMPDGTVYTEAEGSVHNLELFINWLYTGSPLSHVTEVIAEPSPIQGFLSFEIRS